MDQCDGDRLVIRKLVQYMRSEGLQAGDRLPTIRQLAEEWGLSRNVVRDGMLRAQSMAMVKIEPRLGIFVQSPDFSPLVDAIEDATEAALMQDDVNLLQIIEARIAIEAHLAAEAAALRRPKDMLYLRECLESMQQHVDNRMRWVEEDEKFHMRMAKIADNSVMTTFLRILLALLRPYRTRVVWTQEIRVCTLDLHEEIYKCIVEGDVEGARKAVTDHLNANRGSVLATLATVPRLNGSAQADREATGERQTAEVAL